MSSSTPISPALAYLNENPLGGVLLPIPEHFQVEEIPAYLPNGSGEHRYLKIRKTGHNTAQVARLLARLADCSARDVGYAGLKDRNAITTQWFSLPNKSRPTSEFELDDSIEILEESLHRNKLGTGHLHGNIFKIVLSKIEAGRLEAAKNLIQLLRNQGVPNYFGEQRFGRGASNLSLALNTLRQQFDQAEQAKLLKAQARDSLQTEETPSETEGSPEPKTKASRPSRRERKRHHQDVDMKFLISVIQSEHFNRVLMKRIELGQKILSGDIVRLDNAGKHFVVEAEAIAEAQQRLESGDIHLTGPIWGHKTVQGDGEARQLEKGILLGLLGDEALLHYLDNSAPGSRRDLWLKPESLSVTPLDADSCLVEMALPKGSYATVILEELLGRRGVRETQPDE